MISHHMKMVVHFSLHLKSSDRFSLERAYHTMYWWIIYFIAVVLSIDKYEWRITSIKVRKWFANKMDRSGYNHIIIDMCMCTAHQNITYTRTYGCSRFKRNLISLFFFCMLREFFLLYLLLFWILLKLSMWNRLIKFFDGVFNHF